MKRNFIYTICLVLFLILTWCIYNTGLNIHQINTMEFMCLCGFGGFIYLFDLINKK